MYAPQVVLDQYIFGPEDEYRTVAVDDFPNIYDAACRYSMEGLKAIIQIGFSKKLNELVAPDSFLGRLTTSEKKVSLERLWIEFLVEDIYIEMRTEDQALRNILVKTIARALSASILKAQQRESRGEDPDELEVWGRAVLLNLMTDVPDFGTDIVKATTSENSLSA